MKFTDRIRDYGLTLDEDVIICDRSVVGKSADIIDELEAALRDKFCPRPCNNRPADFDVGPCFDAGECGCSANSILAKLEKLNRE